MENCVVYGDWGYRGCEGVIVCGSREMRAKRQVVEGVISQIKLVNAGSGGRTLTCVFVYVYAYAYTLPQTYPLGHYILTSPIPHTSKTFP